jgi:hypothetical protein
VRIVPLYYTYRTNNNDVLKRMTSTDFYIKMGHFEIHFLFLLIMDRPITTFPSSSESGVLAKSDTSSLAIQRKVYQLNRVRKLESKRPRPLLLPLSNFRSISDSQNSYQSGHIKSEDPNNHYQAILSIGQDVERNLLCYRQKPPRVVAIKQIVGY